VVPVLVVATGLAVATRLVVVPGFVAVTFFFGDSGCELRQNPAWTSGVASTKASGRINTKQDFMNLAVMIASSSYLNRECRSGTSGVKPSGRMPLSVGVKWGA
jgi:hypothetical protein